MNRQKDIFNLFRENQHKLNERPSQQAWRRLERRLDAHRDRNRVSIYRHIAMVAAVVAIVALTSLIVVLVEKSQPGLQAVTDFDVEDLKLPDQDASREALMVVEYTRKYQDRMSNPIAEGKPIQKLIPSKIAIDKQPVGKIGVNPKIRKSNQRR